MHLCDKCAKFNKCYPKGSWPTAEQREAIARDGCKLFKELKVEQMFNREKGEKRK